MFAPKKRKREEEEALKKASKYTMIKVPLKNNGRSLFATSPDNIRGKPLRIFTTTRNLNWKEAEDLGRDELSLTHPPDSHAQRSSSNPGKHTIVDFYNPRTNLPVEVKLMQLFGNVAKMKRQVGKEPGSYLPKQYITFGSSVEQYLFCIKNKGSYVIINKTFNKGKYLYRMYQVKASSVFQLYEWQRKLLNN